MSDTLNRSWAALWRSSVLLPCLCRGETRPDCLKKKKSIDKGRVHLKVRQGGSWRNFRQVGLWPMPLLEQVPWLWVIRSVPAGSWDGLQTLTPLLLLGTLLAVGSRVPWNCNQGMVRNKNEDLWSMKTMCLLAFEKDSYFPELRVQKSHESSQEHQHPSSSTQGTQTTDASCAQ